MTFIAVALIGAVSLSGSTDRWAERAEFLAVVSGGAAAVVIAVLTVIVAPTAAGGAPLAKRLTGIRVVAAPGVVEAGYGVEAGQKPHDLGRTG